MDAVSRKPRQDDAEARDHDRPTRLSMRLRDGRRLAYAVYGDPQGRAMFVFHGLPGCRLQAALMDQQARAANVRLIAPDRPGFGLSTPAPQRTILSWADDVEQLADRLGLETFGVLGISCGGAYALACAHQLAPRVAYAGLIAGMGPMDVPHIRRGQHPVLKVMFALARIHPALVSPLMCLDRRMFRKDARRALETLSSMMTPPDRAWLASDEARAIIFAASLVEAYRQGVGGATQEASLIARKREFDLADIGTPVYIYQGAFDRNVPPEMGRYIAEQLRKGRLRLYAREGHLSIVGRAEDAFADFLAARPSLSVG